MDINNSPAGSIILLPEGYRAYIPHPLPPKIEWTEQLVNALSRADFFLGKIAREGKRLPNPELLMRSFIAREAVLSSKIEGTQATIRDIFAYDMGMSVKHDPDDLQEVENYIEALNFGIQRLNDLPLSLRLIKEMHVKLMQGVRGQHATPGEFRKSQNWIGPAGCTLNTAKFVPPPVDVLPECLKEFEKFLHNRQLPPLVHVALCHYQFEAIHPFLDGNGRLGRLLILLLLIERNVLPSPLLYLSAFFEATRDEYYRHLYSVSREGAWHDWILYFLNGVALQSEDALSRAERISEIIELWCAGLRKPSQIALSVINHLSVNPYVTINRVAETFGVAYSTAQRVVENLVASGVIQKVGDNKRDKLYCAKLILSILEEPAKVRSSV